MLMLAIGQLLSNCARKRASGAADTGANVSKPQIIVSKYAEFQKRKIIKLPGRQMKKRYIEPVISWCYTRIFQSYWSPKTILELSFCLCLNWGINSSWPMSRAQLVPETHSIANFFFHTQPHLVLKAIGHQVTHSVGYYIIYIFRV